MTKIFRKVRQKFLEEEKIKKYLLYAIGEIVLVVIGILIALQINSLNLIKKRDKLEKILLEQIRFEILGTYGDIWRDSENLRLGNEAHYYITEFIAQDKPYIDSLCFSFHWLKVDEYFYPVNATYGRIKETGLDIIKNDTIRIALQSLYEGHFPRLTKINSSIPDISNTFNDYYINFFKPNSNLDLQFDYHLADDTVGTRLYFDVYYEYPKKDNNDNLYTIGYVPLDFEDLKNDTRFHMLLEQTKRFRDDKMRRYSIAKATIKEVIKLIERELGIDSNLKN